MSSRVIDLQEVMFISCQKPNLECDDVTFRSTVVSALCNRLHKLLLQDTDLVSDTKLTYRIHSDYRTAHLAFPKSIFAAAGFSAVRRS